MAQPHHSRDERKARLIAEIAQARSTMASSFRDSRENVETARSVASHKALWLTGAAAGGWLIAKLSGGKSRKSARGKKEASAPMQQIERSGWALALLGTAVTMLRPAITSYLTHRLNDYLTGTGDNDHHTPVNSSRR